MTSWLRPLTLLLIPIVILLLVPSPFQVAGLAGGLIWLGLRWMSRGNPAPATPLNVPLVLFLATFAAALALSPGPERAAVIACQVVAGVLVYFRLTDIIERRRDVERAIVMVTALAVLVALAAPFLVRFGPNKLFSLPDLYAELRVASPAEANPNVLAGVAAPAIPLALALVLSSSKASRLFGVAAFLILTTAVLLLQSRGALFALGVGLAVWLVLYQKWLFPVLAVAAVAALILNNTLGGPSPAQILFGNLGTGEYNSYAQRQELWVQGIYLLGRSPLTGIGMGTYTEASMISWPHSPSAPGWGFPHAHNLLLQVALDTGIIGAAAMIVLLALALRALWYARRNPRTRRIATAVFAALVVILAQGLGDTVVWASKSSLILWLYLGLAVGLDKKSVGM
ncbi:MAG: O-antigen ligase family protein [Rudaea sp.]